MTWPTATLDELCEINVGRTPARANPAYWGDGEPWLSIADMNQGHVITRTKEQITAAGAAGGRQVAPGTVLLSFKLSIGKVGRAAMPLYTNEAIAALPIKRTDLITEDFLVRALARANLSDDSNRAAMGATLNKARLKEVLIPVPPLPVQRRIAAILDQADALRAKRRQVLAHLDSLTQSIFHEIFDGNWSTAPLGQIAGTTSGGTPDRAVADNYGGSIPWVKSGELHGGVVTETQESITEQGLRSSSAKLLPAGTVLVAMYGATAGVVGQLGIDAATNQAVCAITPGPRIEADYLIAVLRSMAQRLLAMRTGGAQPNLSQGAIRALDIPVPPEALQHDFSTRIKRVDHERKSQLRAIKSTEALFASLQACAFRGEL